MTPTRPTSNPADNYIRELASGLEVALDFAGTVGGGASWWDDIWAEREAGIEQARLAHEAASQTQEGRQPVAWWPEFRQQDGSWTWATVRPCETEEQAKSVVANYSMVATRIVPLYRG